MPAFPEVQQIRFEGPKSKNPLSFRHYDEKEIVEGKSMREHFRFAVAYWHTFRGTGSDPFGPGTMVRPWESAQDNVDNAINRVRVAFEFMEKLGAWFYCFHDRDVAPEPWVLRAIHPAQPARADRREDLVWAETRARGKAHVRPSTT